MVRKLGIGCGVVILALIVIGVIGASNAPKPSTSTFAPATSTAAAASSSTASSPTASPAPTVFNFGEGKKLVPTDLSPGTYRTRTAASSCYWERLSGLGGTLGEIIANDTADGPAVVTILATDKAFNSVGCGTWSANLSAITSSPTAPFTAGTFIVGVDIAPGTWRSSGGTSCYWQRMSGFSGDLKEVIANENTGPSAIVEIGAGDKGFESERCGTWTKV